MHVLGIDPGLSGALVWLGPGGRVRGVWDAPVVGTRSRPVAHDYPECVALLSCILRESGGRLTAVVEDVAQVQRHGGRVIYPVILWGSRTAWLGMLAALNVRTVLAPVSAWQDWRDTHPHASTAADCKQRSVDLARALWPADQLPLVRPRARTPSVDRAEAALIAAWHQNCHRERGECDSLNW